LSLEAHSAFFVIVGLEEGEVEVEVEVKLVEVEVVLELVVAEDVVNAS